MLYFSHMNPTRSASKESIKTKTEPGKLNYIGELLDELSPFGVFLSQFLYMGSWLFPGNRLPDQLKAIADRLESRDSIEKDKLAAEKRTDALS
jgi:hypothetical protein